MNFLPQKTFGFEYQLHGRNFVFDVVASSQEEAKEQVAAMTGAIYVGQIKAAEPAGMALAPDS